MRILYDYQILSSQNFGGVSRYFYEISKGMKNKNHIVDYGTFTTTNFYFLEVIKNHFNFSNKKYEKNLNKLFVLLKNKNKYDIIHPTFYDPYIIDRFNGKLVVTIHDMIHEIYDFNKGIQENKKKHIYKADKIIAVSENTKKDILRIYPDIPEEKIVVIYHGNSFKKNNKEIGIKLPNKYILYIGTRDVEYKNFKNFIMATSKILIEDKEVFVFCAGGEKFSQKEKELFEKLNIVDRVIHYNFKDYEAYHLYKNALCFVYPSLYEGFGIPLLESMASNCPIVCSNASCFPEVVGDSAIMFNGENVLDIYEKIKTVIYNDELRKTLIKKGEQRLEKFSWEKAVEETEEVYKDLLAK